MFIQFQGLWQNAVLPCAKTRKKHEKHQENLFLTSYLLDCIKIFHRSEHVASCRLDSVANPAISGLHSVSMNMGRSYEGKGTIQIHLLACFGNLTLPACKPRAPHPTLSQLSCHSGPERWPLFVPGPKILKANQIWCSYCRSIHLYHNFPDFGGCTF